MKKSRWTLTLAAGAVVAGLGIAAAAYFTSTAVEAQSTGLPGTIAWMPASASVVGYVDLTSLMASPLRDRWEEELRTRGGESGLDEFRETTGLDPFSDIYGASFAVVPQPGQAGSDGTPDRWGAAVNGAFDSDRLLSKIREEADVTTEDYQGTTIYVVTKRAGEESGDGRPEPAIAFPGTDTMLIGEPHYLREMLDAGAGRSASAAASLTEHWGDGNFAQDTFWIAAAPESGFGGMMPQSGEIPPVQSLTLSGRLEKELALRARGKAADMESAIKLADVVRGFVALGALQRGENPDLGAILDSIQIQQVENEVEVSLHVSYETLERLTQQTKNTEADQQN